MELECQSVEDSQQPLTVDVGTLFGRLLQNNVCSMISNGFFCTVFPSFQKQGKKKEQKVPIWVGFTLLKTTGGEMAPLLLEEERLTCRSCSKVQEQFLLLADLFYQQSSFFSMSIIELGQSIRLTAQLHRPLEQYIGGSKHLLLESVLTIY